MNVIRRKIMDKIEKELADDIDSIVRMELTMVEFKRMLRELINCDHHRKHLSKACIKGNQMMCPSLLDSGLALTPEELSGSYVVYRGVCIQTHVDYNK